MNVLDLQCDPLTVSIVAEIQCQLSIFVNAFVMCTTYTHISRIRRWSDIECISVEVREGKSGDGEQSL